MKDPLFHSSFFWISERPCFGWLVLSEILLAIVFLTPPYPYSFGSNSQEFKTSK